jgi:hypothetical protein
MSMGNDIPALQIISADVQHRNSFNPMSWQKDYPRGHSAKPGGVAIGPPCPAGLSISATTSLDTNETLDARVILQGFRICRYQGCYMAWCEAL